MDWYACLIANPLGKPYDDNGNYLIYPIPENIVIINPLTDLAYDDLDKSYQILTNNYLNLDVPFIKGLTYRLNTGVRTRFTDAPVTAERIHTMDTGTRERPVPVTRLAVI